MTDFVKRIKQDVNNPRNTRQYGGMVLVNEKDLRELVHHFESLDNAFRADYDGNTPLWHQNRRACLAHEIQAAFSNLGAEETLDIVMFTVGELRKHQIIKERKNNESIRLRTSKSARFL